MTQLPRKVGHFTLMRRLGADAVAESYVAILDEPAGKQVVARRIHPAIVDDPVLMSRIRARVLDLEPIRHPAVAQVRGFEEIDGDAYVLEDWVEGIGIDRLIQRARERRVEPGSTLPHNVFLDLAAQVCNGPEALHGRPGQETGADAILHLGMSPQAMVVRDDGQLVLCAHGLIGSPTILPQSASTLNQARMEYLAPEQTHPEQQLAPATDVFALGSVLYELLTLKPLFREISNLQTVHRVRKAEVTAELLEVKDLLPGLDRVLYRALSVNPRHRYQRAFVLREDLRGLMAGYSFADIGKDARAALAPYFQSDGWDEVPAAPPRKETEVESTAALLGDYPSSLFDAPTAPPGTEIPDLDADTMPPGHGRIDHDAPTAPPGARIPGLDDDLDTALPLTDDGTTAAFLREVQGLADGDPPEPPSSMDVPNDTMAYLRAAGATGTEPELSDRHDALEVAPALEDVPIAAMAPDPDAMDAPELSRLDTQERESPFGDAAPPSAVDTVVQTLVETPLPAVRAENRDPVAQAEATAEARKRLAPPDSLVPPASEPPARPRVEAPAPAPSSSDAPDDDLAYAPARSGPPMMVFAIGGAIAAIAVLACLGMGGMGTLLGASQLASSRGLEGGEVAKADVAPAAPAVPAPQRTAPVPAAPEPKPVPETRPVPTAAAVPEPRPAPPSPRPAPSSWTPEPEPVAAAPRPPPPPPVTTAPPPPEPASSTYDAVAFADDVTQREQGTAEAEPLGDINRDVLDQIAGAAFTGGLTSADRSALSAVPADAPVFTRAYTLLYLDAKAKGDVSLRDQYLRTLMALPENQYNPALLVEEAWVAMGRSDWTTALARSDRAERHWARLPSDLIFSRKAMIYEIQAKAHLGSFYASEGDDAGELDRAIKGWQKYKRHAETQGRSDLMASADQQLARLYDIQRRLE